MLVQLGRQQQIRIWGNDLDVSENSHQLGYLMWLQYHCLSAVCSLVAKIQGPKMPKVSQSHKCLRKFIKLNGLLKKHNLVWEVHRVVKQLSWIWSRSSIAACGDWLYDPAKEVQRPQL